MTFTDTCWAVFNHAIDDYHRVDNVDLTVDNPYDEQSIEHLLYRKNMIDTVQWHLEDIIRDPDIDPVTALQLKRRIDRSNQERTDVVEWIDSFFLQRYQGVTPLPSATINTESPAWAIDRLSILALKIYHMREQASRNDATEEHRARQQQRLNVLLTQQQDLATAIDQLLDDIAAGRKYMKVYKQMKLYNDPTTNPVLYNKK